MKTNEQYESEIQDLKQMIWKLQLELTKALEAVAEMHMKKP